MASFTIEDFSLNRVAKVTKAKVDQRLADYKKCWLYNDDLCRAISC